MQGGECSRRYDDGCYRPGIAYQCLKRESSDEDFFPRGGDEQDNEEDEKISRRFGNRDLTSAELHRARSRSHADRQRNGQCADQPSERKITPPASVKLIAR